MFSSIKMKITSAVFALVMLSMSAAALLVNLHNEKTLKKTIFSELESHVSAAARHIDENLFEALVYLDDTADLVTPELLAVPVKAQQFLDFRKTQQGFYNSALVIFNSSGTVIAASPAASNPIGQNFAHREYFQETVRTGKMVVSRPILSAQKPKQIIIMFTSPLYDAQGKVAGVLGGAVSIQKQRYLQSLRFHKLGHSGYLSLYDSTGKAIMHPDPLMLLTSPPPDSPVGRAVKGYRGTEESVAEDGKRVIRSVRRLQATDWILAATLPVEQAYAPLYAARKYLVWAGVLASVLSALSVWHLIRTLLAPLSAFTLHLKQPTANGTPEPVRISSNDEIGVMAQAFNAMISGMEESAEKIARLSRVIEQCPFTVVIAALDGTIEYANPLIAERGVSVDEVIGRNLCTLVPDSCFGAGAAMRQALARGAEWQGEVVRKGKAGEEWTHVSLSRLTNRNGDATHFVAIFKDITPRKEAEQALRVSEALHRQIFEENPQPMWVYDRETLAFLAVNNAAVRHYGYSRAEFLAMTIVDIRPPAEVPSLLAELSHKREGFRDAGVWQHLKKDGTVIQVSITSHPLEYMGSEAEIILVQDVTAQKKAESELRLSEERYREIFDGVADIIFSVAPDTSFVSLNHAFNKILGWSHTEWVGRSFTGLIHDEDMPHVAKAFASCVAGNPVSKLEYRARTAEGDFVYLEVDATPLLGNGRIIQVQGIARDITERKVAQQKQEYLQRRLSAMWNIASMVDGRPEALQEMVLKEITSMTRSRRGFFASVDRSRDEIALHSWSADEAGSRGAEILPLDSSGILEKAISCRSALIDNDYSGSGSPLDSAGAPAAAQRIIAVPILVEGEVVAIYAATGKVSGYTGMDAEHMNSFLKNVQIILEKRRAEQSLLKLSHAINQNPVSVVITDAQGKIEFVNPRFTELTGYGTADVLGRKPSFLSAEQKPGQETEDLWQTLTAGRVWNGIFLNRKKNGDVFWGRVTISSIRNKGNEITNYLGIIEDITERLQLEQQLRQSQKMEALGTLTGGIAHDFNNILTSIAAYCALLEKMTPPEEGRKRHYLEKVIESTGRASALTRSLLAYSRNQPLNKQVIDVNDVLDDVSRLLAPVIGEDIEFRVRKSPRAMTVLGDRHQLVQVLMNLAMNARDAMPGGGVLEIELERVSSGDQADRVPGYLPPASYIRLLVSDTGTGIDEQTRERIFEPFFTTKEVNKGTGLGLSIVYGIVNQHQGHIDFRSEVGQGTVFSIYLPLTDESAAQSMAAAGNGDGRGHGTILLVEDEGEIRAPLKELLEGSGYRVIEAADGEEAVAKYRLHSNEVRVVILDVVMPKKNGRQAYDEMRQITPDMKVLFISGYTSDILSSKGFSGDDINFIAKPIAIDPLLSKIREVLPDGR